MDATILVSFLVFITDVKSKQCSKDKSVRRNLPDAMSVGRLTGALIGD